MCTFGFFDDEVEEGFKGCGVACGVESDLVDVSGVEVLMGLTEVLSQVGRGAASAMRMSFSSSWSGRSERGMER